MGTVVIIYQMGEGYLGPSIFVYLHLHLHVLTFTYPFHTLVCSLYTRLMTGRIMVWALPVCFLLTFTACERDNLRSN